MVRESFRDGGDLSSSRVKGEHVLRRVYGRLVLKEASLVRQVREGDMGNPSLLKFLSDVFGNHKGRIRTHETGNTGRPLEGWCYRINMRDGNILREVLRYHMPRGYWSARDIYSIMRKQGSYWRH